MKLMEKIRYMIYLKKLDYIELLDEMLHVRHLAVFGESGKKPIRKDAIKLRMVCREINFKRWF